MGSKNVWWMGQSTKKVKNSPLKILAWTVFARKDSRVNLKNRFVGEENAGVNSVMEKTFKNTVHRSMK
jgi:hypothetical protein